MAARCSEMNTMAGVDDRNLRQISQDPAKPAARNADDQIDDDQRRIDQPALPGFDCSAAMGQPRPRQAKTNSEKDDWGRRAHGEQCERGKCQGQKRKLGENVQPIHHRQEGPPPKWDVVGTDPLLGRAKSLQHELYISLVGAHRSAQIAEAGGDVLAHVGQHFLDDHAASAAQQCANMGEMAFDQPPRLPASFRIRPAAGPRWFFRHSCHLECSQCS